MDSSPGFGSSPCHSGALFTLAFAPPPALLGLRLATRTNSSAHSSIGTPSRKSLPLRLLVSARFQDLFHSPSGVLFTFPSRYSFAIGHQQYLALERGRPRFPRNFTCSVVLRCRSGATSVSSTGLSPTLVDHSRSFNYRYGLSLRAVTPERPSGPSTRHDAWGWRP